MLQSFRDNLKGVTATIIIGLLIIPFVFFGVESIFVSGSSVDQAALVNGEKITQLELDRGVEFQKQKILGQFQDVDPTLLDDALLQGPVLDQLIRQKLIIQAATDSGMAVADQTFNEIILKDESFQEGGKFDKALYEYKLGRLGYTPLSYREAVKAELLANQLTAGLQFSAIVSQRELDNFSHLALQQRSFDYVTLAGKAETAVEVSEDEIAAYYKSNQDTFQEPDKVVVDYIELTPQLLESSVEVTEKQIAERLESAEQAGEGSGQAWQLAHILVESGDGESQKTKVAEIQKRLAEGADFAALAKEFSDDFGTAETGGELGRLTKDALPPGFEDAVAGLGAGDVSEPVELESGVHFIKVLDVSAAEPASPALERDAVIAKLKVEQALEKLPAMLERLKEETFSADSLASAAEAVGLPLLVSEPFSAEGGTGIAKYPEVAKIAFGDEVLKEGFASEVIELGENHYAVIKLKQLIPSHALPLAEVSTQISEVLKIRKAQAEIKARGEALLAELKSGKSLQVAAEEQNLTISTESSLTRFDQRLTPELVKAVFQPSANTTLPVTDMLTTLNGDVYIFSLKEIKSGKVDMLSEEERKSMWLSLGQVTASEEYLAYLDAVEASAEIVRRGEAAKE